MLIGDEGNTTANYISDTHPIPAKKDEIAICTAMAGEMLGLKLIYLDGGSGAEKVIRKKMIKSVSEHIHIPLIVGGGITTAEDAAVVWEAGADMIVVGNAIEERLDLVSQISAQLKSMI
jgi:putative glycerol-1-phosphate prenyltransferase